MNNISASAPARSEPRNLPRWILQRCRPAAWAEERDTAQYIHLQSHRRPNWHWSHASIDPPPSGFTTSAVSFRVVLHPPSTFGLGELQTSGGWGGCSSAAPLAWWNMMRQRWDKPNEDGGGRGTVFSFSFRKPVSPCGSHRDVDCLMLWKLTREGDVGIDMAWVIRARMECCSCHRWKRFLTAERTCHTACRQAKPANQWPYIQKAVWRAKETVITFRFCWSLVHWGHFAELVVQQPKVLQFESWLPSLGNLRVLGQDN